VWALVPNIPHRANIGIDRFPLELPPHDLLLSLAMGAINKIPPLIRAFIRRHDWATIFERWRTRSDNFSVSLKCFSPFPGKGINITLSILLAAIQLVDHNNLDRFRSQRRWTIGGHKVQPPTGETFYMLGASLNPIP
jgi:hypothetical protein